MEINNNIIISRTDKIGDVILTLPLVALLKEKFKALSIIFLGNTYTKPVLKCCPYVDEIYEWDTMMKYSESKRVSAVKSLNANVILHVFPNIEVAKTAFKAGIKHRIGTSHRYFHLLYCNKLLHFSRKNSTLHEAQLNLKFLKPFNNVESNLSVEQLSQMPLLTKIPTLNQETEILLDRKRKNIILHPYSRKSARQWPIEYYIDLCNILSEEKYNLIFTGTEDEAQKYRPFLGNINRNINDAGGKLSLEQYISLISSSDGLVASSTGPLHIAAAVGIHAFGIYPPIRPMHPGRWAPIGKNVHIFVKNIKCRDCRKTKTCHCIREITPDMVAKSITSSQHPVHHLHS